MQNTTRINKVKQRGQAAAADNRARACPDFCYYANDNCDFAARLSSS